MVNFYIDGLFVDNLRKASDRLMSASHEKTDPQNLISAVDNLSKAVPVSVDNGQTLCDYREMAQALCREPSSFLVKGAGSSDYPKWLHDDLAHVRGLIHSSMSIVQQVITDINKIVTLPLPALTPLLKANLRGVSQSLSDLAINYQIHSLSMFPPVVPYMPMPSNICNPAYPIYPGMPYLTPPYRPALIPTPLPGPTEPVPHFPSTPEEIPTTGFLKIPDMQAPFDPRLKQIPDALIPTGPLSRHLVPPPTC